MSQVLVLAAVLGCALAAAGGAFAEAPPAAGASFKLTLVYGTNLLACVEPCG